MATRIRCTLKKYGRIGDTRRIVSRIVCGSEKDNVKNRQVLQREAANEKKSKSTRSSKKS